MAEMAVDAVPVARGDGDVQAATGARCVHALAGVPSGAGRYTRDKYLLSRVICDGFLMAPPTALAALRARHVRACIHAGASVANSGGSFAALFTSS